MATESDVLSSMMMDFLSNVAEDVAHGQQRLHDAKECFLNHDIFTPSMLEGVCLSFRHIVCGFVT